MSNETYERFISRVKEVKTLSSIGAVLHWDQETQMPAKGSEGRSEQLALVSGLAHDRLVSDDVGELLDRLGKDDSLSELERVNVREVRRAFDRERKLPTELVQELAKTQSLAHVAWAGAKKNNDYAAFAPVLEKIIALRKKAAGLINGLGDKATGDGLYDTLLDEFEPGAKTAEIRPLFESLRKDLVPLVAKIASSSTKAEAIAGHYPASKQREFGVLVTKAMGFDYDAGRLDVSAHPFCTTFNTHDVRLTTRYDEKDFRVALFGSMHEAGHGLYEQGMDYAHNATPLAEAASMGIHESQSRLWENMVGRSRAFWTTYYPKLQKTFPETLSSVPFEKFFLSVNVVKPSLIRVEADEVTYNLHILLRFELEQAIMNDEVSVSALPALWNRKMEDYLGVKPPNDAQGVLQDIHWSMGAFGYFPTYTLGNMYAAQLFNAARKDIADFDGKLERGEFQPLREWLRENVHRHGMRYRSEELCRKATGEALNAKHFTGYLTSKFSEIYKI